MATLSCYAIVGRHAPACQMAARPRASPLAFSSSSVCRKSRPLSVACAAPENKNHYPPAFDIPPFALVDPISPEGEKHWDISDDEQQAKLWFQVPGLTKEDLEVKVDENVLMINKRSNGGTQKLKGAHLLLTKYHDKGRVDAELKDGVLVVIVGKKQPALRKSIPVKIK